LQQEEQGVPPEDANNHIDDTLGSDEEGIQQFAELYAHDQRD